MKSRNQAKIIDESLLREIYIGGNDFSANSARLIFLIMTLKLDRPGTETVSPTKSNSD